MPYIYSRTYVRLFFLTNFQGPMFIPCPMSISDFIDYYANVHISIFRCDMVNLPDSDVISGFKCNKIRHFKKALNYCCADPEAVTSLPTCP